MSNTRNRGSTSTKDAKETKDSWICGLCRKEFKDDSSKILECERCELHFCAKCMKMGEDIYDLLSTRKDIHWFCGNCEQKVMHNIHIDKEMEQRCNEYFKNLENSLSEIKADQLKMENRMEALKEDVNKHLKKISGDVSDLQTRYADDD